MERFTREAFVTAVERAKREVCRDVRAGYVPVGVRSFADLHDYVDANYYGGAFDVWEEGDAGCDVAVGFWNGVQGAIDEWLRSGGRRSGRP